MSSYKQVKPVKYDRRKHDISFRNAFNGIMLAYKTQPNFRFHLLFLFLITVASIIYRISISEYVAILVISSLVITAEMVNTAVEALGDEIAGNEYRKLIGVAKDVSAGAVLISAMFAIVVGIFIFLPKFLLLLDIDITQLF